MYLMVDEEKDALVFVETFVCWWHDSAVRGVEASSISDYNPKPSDLYVVDAFIISLC